MTYHLLIIDALNLIRRLHAVQGSQCLSGCLSAAKQLLHHSQPTHVVAVFDHPDRKSGWRHQYFPDYKAGRSAMPEDLAQQLPHIEAALADLGIQSWTSPDEEADDLAATLAAKMAHAGHQVTLVSTDKGYCQLLSPRIQIRDYFQKRWLDVPFIQQEYGVLASQLVDYWGLCGIASSKIPGVPGIGQKSAQALIAQYGQLEQIYQNRDAIPAKWQAKLDAGRELAFISRQLAQLKTDLILSGNLRQLRYLPPAGG
ncbi:flap endonuclease Xni [Rosenbergiella australiborealis]|uniref:Flap endonuclease Xni n=1 Tax=Rosenbergiella australiborealis TaxID=1544696 RepID=A0ABS5T753_9GAMM|nr:flap endonuclease Xni [Rosenbergiella australiborealis]MBT0727947.1 flap endonuclease Xni [Rosenbergiella australiborealis]